MQRGRRIAWVCCLWTALTLAVSRPAAAQNYDWTGFYFGGQLGYAWDEIDVTRFSGRIDDFSGSLGGAHLGGNVLQQGAFVLGAIADINWVDGSTSASTLHVSSETIDTCGEGCLTTIATSISSRLDIDLDWKATVRGKLGFLPAPNLLVFATTGAAFARLGVRFSEVTLVTTTPPPPDPVTTSLDGSDDRTLTGIVFGGGFEMMILPNVSIYSEVLHYDFSSEIFDLAGHRFGVDLDETVVLAGFSFYLN
ncbi:MAG: outer membrane protein [Hyphomicrobium sp.]